jgi:hypothetical protein
VTFQDKEQGKQELLQKIKNGSAMNDPLDKEKREKIPKSNRGNSTAKPDLLSTENLGIRVSATDKSAPALVSRLPVSSLPGNGRSQESSSDSENERQNQSQNDSGSSSSEDQVPPMAATKTLPRRTKHSSQSSSNSLNTDSVQGILDLLTKSQASLTALMSQNAVDNKKSLDATLTLIKEKNNRTPNEEFDRSVDDDFYINLPPPWNVLPRKKGKVSDEKSYMGLSKDNLFSGDSLDWPSWRASFIHLVHQSNLDVLHKLNVLVQRLNPKDEWLNAIAKGVISWTPQDYENIIGMLEDRYGGNKRIMKVLRNTLLQSTKINRKDINSLRLTLKNFEAFRDYSAQNGMSNNWTSDLTYDLVLEKIFSKDRDEDLRAWGMAQEDWGYAASMTGLVCWIRSLIKGLAVLEDVRATPLWNKTPTLQTGPRTLLVGNLLGSHSDNQEELTNTSKISQPTMASLDSVQETVPKTIYEEWDSDAEELSGQSDDETAITLLATKEFKPPLCPVCKPQSHLLIRCEKFPKLSHTNRYKALMEAKMCFKCFSNKHEHKNCDKVCKDCGKGHHKLLCKR